MTMRTQSFILALATGASFFTASPAQAVFDGMRPSAEYVWKTTASISASSYDDKFRGTIGLHGLPHLLGRSLMLGLNVNYQFNTRLAEEDALYSYANSGRGTPLNLETVLGAYFTPGGRYFSLFPSVYFSSESVGLHIAGTSIPGRCANTDGGFRSVLDYGASFIAPLETLSAGTGEKDQFQGTTLEIHAQVTQELLGSRYHAGEHDLRAGVRAAFQIGYDGETNGQQWYRLTPDLGLVVESHTQNDGKVRGARVSYQGNTPSGTPFTTLTVYYIGHF